MKGRILTGLLALATLAVQIPVNAESSSVNVLYYYVSQNGSPSGDGSIDNPFPNLDKAKLAMRKIRDKDQYDEVRILIRGGKYEVSDTIQFTPEDRGGDKTPLVVSNYPGEKVIFTGGKDIDMSKAVNVTDSYTLSRIPAEARDKVLQIDLKAQGLTGLGNVPQTYYAVYNTGTTTDLLWNGETCNRARWPNEDYAYTGSVLYAPESWYSDSGLRTPPPGDPGVIFKVDAPRVSMWKDAPYAWLFGYYGNDWSTYALAIKDVQSNIVFTKTSPGFGISKGRKYYIFNLIEEMDAPGEWYIDKDNEILYIYPKGEITEDTNVCFTVLEKTMMNINGCKNLRIEGITFENSKARAVSISDSENCEVAGCVMRNMSAGAASVGGHKCGLRSCKIENTGSTAVSLGGGNCNTLEPGGNYVVNCEFSRWAQVKRVYNGAVVVSGCGQYIAYNDMYDCPHYAMGVSGNNHIIEYNEIHDVVKETADSGSIYIGRRFTDYGNIYRYNYFHDIGNTVGGTFTAVGIYFDDMGTAGTIYGNLFVRVDNPVLIGGGNNNHVENNVIVDAPKENTKISIDYDSRGSEERWKNSLADMIVKAEDVNYHSDAWLRMYPQLAKMLDSGTDMRFPHNSTVKNNVIVNHKPMDIHENVSIYGEVSDNLETPDDVGFVDRENGDYRLREDSLVYKVLPGFKKVDYENAGLYNDEYRIGNDKQLREYK